MLAMLTIYVVVVGKRNNIDVLIDGLLNKCFARVLDLPESSGMNHLNTQIRRAVTAMAKLQCLPEVGCQQIIYRF